MKTVIKVVKPETIQMQMTITMSLEHWTKIADAIKTANISYWHDPANTFMRDIEDNVRNMVNHYEYTDHTEDKSNDG